MERRNEATTKMKDTIIVDSNEPQKIIDEIQKRANFKVKVESLDQGDFLYPHQSVAIERKTGSDLAGSIQDRRVKEQVTRMRAEHDHVYLIAEGELFNLPHSNMHKNSITGQMISLAVKNGARIIPTKDHGNTGYAVNRVFERHRDQEHLEQTQYLKRHDTGEVENTQLSMLMQIDGISEEKARTILNNINFGQLIDCYSHPGEAGPEYAKDVITGIDGIGPKTVKKLAEAFT